MAERWGLVARNVARLGDPPRVPRHEISPLTPEQARRLIELAEDDRYRALYVTALGTGLRQWSCWGCWEDADLEAGRLRVRHTLACVEGELTLLPTAGRGAVITYCVTCYRAGATRTRGPGDLLRQCCQIQ